MDLNDIGEAAEDRISKLPDSLLHHILSFLDIKCVARTCLLSKRWEFIWTSVPALIFPYWSHYEPPSLPEVNKFMEFVDRALLLHDTSNIQKFRLNTSQHMSASRVHSWIENLTRRHNVEEFELWLDPDKPINLPLSLFTCQSLIKLKLYAAPNTTRLPKNFSFPKLKSLKLGYFHFTDECSWNEQQFSDCPVLENLILDECNWLGATNFCISSPALKLLEFMTTWDDDCLRDCVLKINAPNLVSLIYSGCVAKKYVLSSFRKLESVEVRLIYEDGVPRNQSIGYCAAASKFIQTLSHVQYLEIHAETLKALSIVDGFINILPTFHCLNELCLREGETTDKSLFSLFKAVPNLRWLFFQEGCINGNKDEDNSWASHIATAGCMFEHLESVRIECFNGNARQMRWVKLILKNAKDLEVVTLSLKSDYCINEEAFRSELLSLPRQVRIAQSSINEEALRSELLSLPRTSDRCEFELSY